MPAAAIAAPRRKAGDLLGAFDVARVTDHFGGVLESRVGQTAQHFGVGAVIDDAVKRPTVGIKAAANAGDADARALHTGVQQRPRHAFAPGILHRPRLRHPVVAGLLVRNNDRLAAVARQNHCGVVEASEKAAIRARAARLLKREMQIASIDAERHEDAIEASLRGALAHAPPAPVALG